MDIYSKKMIRNFEQQDLDQVVRIWLEGSLIAHNFIPEDYWKGKSEEMREIYLPSSKTFVYENAELLGFISMKDNYIAALFVDPKEQGKGIGKQILNFVKCLYPSLELNVYAENLNSVEFYKKQGFVILEENIEEDTGHKEYKMRYTSDIQHHT